MFSGSSEVWCPLGCWELKVLTRDRSLKQGLLDALMRLKSNFRDQIDVDIQFKLNSSKELKKAKNTL